MINSGSEKKKKFLNKFQEIYLLLLNTSVHVPDLVSALNHKAGAVKLSGTIPVQQDVDILFEPLLKPLRN